jgi:arsenate reductase
MKKVVFVCVENAGRSQMAEAFANYFGKGTVNASSGGI